MPAIATPHDQVPPPRMPPGARATRMRDGRLHLQHGPIDLICGVREACGPAAYDAAQRAFAPLLGGLVAELPRLRTPWRQDAAPFAGTVAQRMAAAIAPQSATFITPMAAVAGAVADEVLSAMRAATPLTCAYVNNGGDIAVHLDAGRSLRVGLVRSLARAAPEGIIALAHGMGVGGIATSGWPGRSFSLGIADAVTVLAENAAAADAAATIIANAVDAPHPDIRREPARARDPDSDLGELLVTVDVPRLPEAVVEQALEAGLREAEAQLRRGHIIAALLCCQDRLRVVGLPAALPSMLQWD